MLTEIILIVFLVICIFHYYTRCGRIGKLVKNIPGLPDWPLVGGLPYVICLSREEKWLVYRKLNQEFYPIFKCWTTQGIIINIRHPDDIQILLSSTEHIDKCAVYQFLHPWLKTGLLTSTGKKWQLRRKILTPAFHFNILKNYMDIIIDNCEKKVKSFQSGEENEYIINLIQFTSYFTLNIICEAAMGVSLHDMEDDQKKYRHSILNMGDILLYRAQRPWLFSEYVFNLTKKGKEQVRDLKVLHGFSKKIIKDRREYHEKTNDMYLNQLGSEEKNDENDIPVFGTRKKRMALLDLLISSSKTEGLIDDEGIQEEVDTIMFEGSDTSAAALLFALLLLAENKDAQARARSEVNTVFDKIDGKIGYSELQQLNYLDMCIKESLRLYPSVPFISRKITKDLQLKNHVIPGGATIQVHIFDLHRDVNFWTEPDKFDPMRFIPEKIKNIFSYIPFSAGPRNCIGQKFVMMELKTTIAYLLRNFLLEPIDLAHEVPLKIDLVIRPARPVHLKLIPIHNEKT